MRAYFVSQSYLNINPGRLPPVRHADLLRYAQAMDPNNSEWYTVLFPAEATRTLRRAAAMLPAQDAYLHSPLPF